MSLREFLEGDCGQLNPVLKVASHFTQDVSLRETFTAGSGIAAAAAFSVGTSSDTSSDPEALQRNHSEVSLPPTTFRMDALLQEIQSMEQSSPAQFLKSERRGTLQGPLVNDFVSQSDWAEDFRKTEQDVQVVGGAAWAEEYFSPELDPIWDHSREMYTMPIHHSDLPQIFPVDRNTMQSPQELLHDSKWATEYADVPGTLVMSGQTELMQTADEFLKSVSDPSIRATEFMSFVEKLSNGETKLASSTQKNIDTSQQWADEYEFQFGTTDGSSDWVEHFAGQEDLGPGPRVSENVSEAKENFWQNMENEWDRLAHEEVASHPWLTESTSALNQAYIFNDSNPFQETTNPLEEGKLRLREGDIPSAVLAFEAAVQKDSENPECWLLLGSTQAQNEQDPLAISALNKCLQLQPNNLTALMNLAASLTNESYQLQACNALKNWLKANPKYSDLVNEDMVQEIPKMSTILPMEELTNVQKLFVRAARLNPFTSVDADVQSGLGILFNLSSDFERAADCFKSALSVTPNDSLLWNRLGATLANGGKPTEAIGAYRKALEISPGFIRTRYNLGISCVNLGAYREAAQHFLSSLNQQAAGKPSATAATSKSNVVSNSIWSSLRMILHLMDKADLSPAVDSRDLLLLNREFNITQ